MTDIDFEELDRAVHSIMNKQQDASAAPIAQDSPAEQSTPSHQAQTPAPAVTAPTLAPAADPSSSPTPSVIKRSSGKFMDVVHPSSSGLHRHAAVATRRAAYVPPKPLSPHVTPANNDIVPPKSHAPAAPSLHISPSTLPAPVAQAPANSPATDELSEKIAASLQASAVAGSSMDGAPATEGASTPLVMDTSLQSLPAQSGSDEASVTSESKPSDTSALDALLGGDGAITEPTTSSETPATDPARESVFMEPIVSPFLDHAHALVDKRPLGQVETDDVTNADHDAPSLTLDSSAASGDRLAMSTAPAASNDLFGDIVQDAAARKSSVDTPSVAENMERHLAADDADSSAESLFDTATYPDPSPLGHKEPKKSGMLTVLLIVLLLIIGVAGGAAAYFFLLQ